MEKYLDEMFEVLYGEITDEEGRKFSDEYRYECRGVCEDFKEYFDIIKKYRSINIHDVGSLIVLSEQMHIGNDLDIDYDGLESLASKIFHELNEESRK